MHQSSARRARALRLTIVVLLLMGLGSVLEGCALLGAGRSRALLEEARAAYKQREFETAYLRSKQIGLEYPESHEADEAFSMAAQSLKVLYYRDRHAQPDSVWVTAEPVFMFGWLARYFEAGAPTDAANAFFIGFPVNVFREFQEYTRTRPALSQWVLQARDDNGMIQSVTADRAEARAS